jgi:hypothetical protein
MEPSDGQIVHLYNGAMLPLFLKWRFCIMFPNLVKKDIPSKSGHMLEQVQQLLQFC